MRVHAPGKVVLLGEYAVLDGAPAIVAAVDRGVTCTVEPHVEVVWHTPDDDRFAAAALRAVGAGAGRYRFEDWRPVQSTTKVGLGGSAAATVAAVYAGLAWGRPRPDPATVHTEAFAVHHAVQGSGSGIDVAASAHGGVLRFQGGQVEPLPLVHPAVVFSGTSAKTGPRVAQYLAWPDRARFAEQSAEIVRAFASDPVAATAAGGQALRTMASAAGIAYWTEGIDALVTLARDCGGAAKPSGAGGGDIVVGLFPDADRRRAYERRAAAAGFEVVEVAVAPGVREAE
ncbi:MAG: hypothetical protein KTR31_40240 [Myxococcales bacterium]|nr:hypothetical protein [Myxococcales bacterium]